MESHRWARCEFNLARVAAIAIEHIDGSKLIEFEARVSPHAVLQLPR